MQTIEQQLETRRASAALHTDSASSQSSPRPSLDSIMETGLAFWASKTLLSAVELGVFTALAERPLNAETLRARLGLHSRGARDFFDALVAMKFLTRRQDTYANTPEADYYLVRNKPTYAGGILEMCSTRLFAAWGSLTEALRTGQPRNESRDGSDPFSSLYSTPEKLQSFLSAMTGISLSSAMAIAEKFPWHEYQNFADIGAAQGAVTVQVALKHPHLKGLGYDLPQVQPVFERYTRHQGVSERVKFISGDFFKDPLPASDVLIMGHILHDWDLAQKQMLLAKAYAALPPGGALIVHEAIIDDSRNQNVFGLLMSLNMLIETPGGFDYTGRDCQQWMREAGFRKTRVEHLSGPDSMVIGIK